MSLSSKPSWIKKQTSAKDFEIIQCPPWNDYTTYRQDDGCYVLIKILRDTREISVGICDYAHTLLKEFRGKKAQELYFTLFEYERQHNLSWFTRKDHIAYLGKELKKAELALETGQDFVQE